MPATLKLNVDPGGVVRGSGRARQSLKLVQESAQQTGVGMDRLEDKSTRAMRSVGRSSTRAAAQVEQFESRSKRAMRSVGLSADQLNSKFKTAARGVAALAAGIATLGAGQAVRQFRDLDVALGEVSTLIDGTAREMDFLETRVHDLAGTFGGSAVRQANAFYQAISAGAATVEDADNILIASNKLRVAGVTDVITATDLLTTVLNSYGFEANQAERISDKLFTTVRAGKTTIRELSSDVGRGAKIMAEAGVTIDEYLAAIATLTAGGISTAEAVTALRGTIAAILKPSNEATAAADRLGLAFNATELQSRKLAGFMREVQRATRGNTEELIQLFGRIDSMPAVVDLAGSSTERFHTTLDQLTNSAGETEVALEKIQGTLSQRYSAATAKLRRETTKLGEAITEKLVPAVEFLAEHFNKILIVGGGVLTVIAGLAIALGGLAAAPWLIAGAGVVGLASLLAGLTKEAKEAKEAQEDLNNVLEITVTKRFPRPRQSFQGEGEAGSSFDVSPVLDGLPELMRAREAQAAAADKLNQSLERVRTTIDPVYAATQRYNSALDILKQGLEAGAISKSEYAQRVGQLKARLDDLKSSFSQTASVAGGEYRQSLEDVLQSIDPVYAATQRYRSAVDVLNAALARGDLSADQHRMRLEQLKNQYDSLTQTQNQGAASAARFFTSIVNGSRSATQAIGDLAGQLSDKLLNQGFELLLNSLFGGGGGSGGGGDGGFLSFLFSKKGNAFDSAGLIAANDNRIEQYNRGGVFNGPTLFNPGGAGENRLGVLGEAGPEAILPLSRSSDGKLGVKSMGSAGAVNVSVVHNIDARGTNNEAVENLRNDVQRQRAQLRGDVIRYVNQARQDRILQ